MSKKVKICAFITHFFIAERTLPYWNDVIVPQMRAGKRVLIAAHGNSLRGIVKHLDNMTDEEIMGCNLPTGIPFVYELDNDLKVFSRAGHS